MREREQRLLRHLRPEAHELLALARRLTGYDLTVKRVHELGGDIRGALIYPLDPAQSYELHYLRGQESILDQIIAHEVGHLVRLYRVPESERLRGTLTPPAHQRAFQQLVPELAALAATTGAPGEVLAALFDHAVDEIGTMLVNYPAHLRIEQWSHEQFPGLRPLQARALTAEVQRGYPLLIPRARASIPPTVYSAKMGMNAAEALQVSKLFHSPNLLAPYRRRGFGDIARELTELVLAAPDEGHRSDMRASEVWAQVLGVPGWFAWEAYQEHD